MKKKIFKSVTLLLLLVIVTVAGLSGCGKKTYFGIGSWKDKTFESSWLDMKFKSLDDWTITSDDDLAKAMGKSTKQFNELKGNNEKSDKAAKDLSNIYSFILVRTKDTDNINIQLAYENLALTKGGKTVTEKEYLKSALDTMSQSAAVKYKVEKEGTEKIAGKTFHYLKVTANDGAVNQDFYCFKKGNYMTILMSSYTPGAKELNDEFMSGISKLK